MELCQAPFDAPGELAAAGIAYHAHDPVKSQIFKCPKLDRIVACLEGCPFTRHAEVSFDFDVRPFATQGTRRRFALRRISPCVLGRRMERRQGNDGCDQEKGEGQASAIHGVVLPVETLGSKNEAMISLRLSILRHGGEVVFFLHDAFGEHDVIRIDGTRIAASRLMVGSSRRGRR